MTEDEIKDRADLLRKHWERVAHSQNAMRLWKGLCGKYPENYGIRMPENLTCAALMAGVLAS